MLSPPMMPASPIGPLASVIARTSGYTSTVCSLSSFTLLPAAAEADVDAALQLVEVVDVQRTAELEHHVVRDVHQRGDRTLPRALEAALHPLRGRRGGVHVPDHAPREAAAAGRVGDLHRERRIDLLRDRPRVRQRELGGGQRRDLPGDAQHREAIGAVRRQLDREDLVFEVEHLTHVAPERRVGGQHEQSGVIVRQTELARRAEHPVRLDAAQRGLLDRDPRQLGPDERDRRLHSGRDVRRAAHDRERAPLPRVHLAHGELVRVRVARDLEDLSDHDLRERRRDRVDRFDLEARHRQQVRERLRGQRRVDHRAEPAFRKLHDRVRRTAAGSGGRRRRRAADR